MRLIRTDNLQLEHVSEDKAPPYAILSHTWGPNDSEVTLQEFTAGNGRDKAGYQKIKGCCEQAANDGFEYAWVDTCWLS